jgi:hypothetical protein
MKIDTKLGTFEDVFKDANKKVKEIAIYLDQQIKAFDTNVVIVPRAGEKSVAYGVGPKKMSQAYCYVMPQRDYLNLGFYHGTSLYDPDTLLEGTGNKLRHVKLGSIESAKHSNVMNLIRLARKDRISSVNN